MKTKSYEPITNEELEHAKRCSGCRAVVQIACSIVRIHFGKSMSTKYKPMTNEELEHAKRCSGCRTVVQIACSIVRIHFDTVKNQIRKATKSNGKTKRRKRTGSHRPII